MEVVGLIGSICFAICAIPAAYEAWRQKVCYYSWPTLILWFSGEVLTFIYALSIEEWILLFNYGANFLCLLVLLYYNQRPSSKSDQQ